MTDQIRGSRRKLTQEAVGALVDQSKENPATPHQEAADPFYEAYFCETIVLLAEQMRFPEEWAAEMGVTERRMFGWLAIYPEFGEAYEIAITKLRAQFTRDFVNAASGKGFPDAIPAMYILLAKKRFPDLFGDVPAHEPTGHAPPKDITPTSGEIIDHAPIVGSEADKLRAELKELRGIHGEK